MDNKGDKGVEKSIDKSVGRRIKEVRMNKGLSLVDVASSTSIAVQSLSAIENGKKGVGLKSLVMLSDLLNISLDYLVYGKSRFNPSLSPRSGFHASDVMNRIIEEAEQDSTRLVKLHRTDEGIEPVIIDQKKTAYLLEQERIYDEMIKNLSNPSSQSSQSTQSTHRKK